MEHGDVAEADDPFGLFAQRREVEQREQAHRSVAALIADDGFHAGIVDHGLQVCGAPGVGPGEVGLFAVGVVRSEFHFQPPLFEAFPDFGRVGLLLEFARRGDDAYGVTRPQVGRADERRVGFLGGERVGLPEGKGVRIGVAGGEVCRAEQEGGEQERIFHVGSVFGV